MQNEPTKTDEKLDEPAKKRPDMDSALLSGCLTVAAISIAVYGLVAWPFFVYEMHTRAGLVSAGLFGFLPAVIVGGIAVNRLGLTGGTGFAGGAVASGLFVYLQLNNLALGSLGNVEDLPPPDYPELWIWLLPLIWCLLTVAIVLVLLPKRELEDEVGGGSNR